MTNAAKLIKNNLPKLKMALEKTVSREVLVGVPADKTSREESGVNNATLAYVHDNGSPARNIPAREFMRPGVEAAKEPIAEQFKIAAEQALEGHSSDIPLHKAGLLAQASIRARLDSNIAPALKPETIKNRRKSRGTKSMRKGEKHYMQLLEAGATPEEAQGIAGIVALENTGQLRNSINYVVRTK